MALYVAEVDVIVRLRRRMEVFATSDADALTHLEGLSDEELFRISEPRPNPVTIFETYLLKVERQR